MTLGKKDKAVLEAFSEAKPCAGHKLSTDGIRLDGHWMGGTNIAQWRAVGTGHDYIECHDLGSRAAQSVQRALKKIVPANWFVK